MATDINKARKAFSEYLQGKENFKKSLDGAFLAAMEVIYREAFEEGRLHERSLLESREREFIKYQTTLGDSSDPADR